MDEKHGGALLLQVVEPKRLIGAMMSVAMGNGEDWIHFAFSNDANSFESTNDGVETKLVLSRPVALSLVGLLRIALAQFPVLHGHSGAIDGEKNEKRVVAVVSSEASRRTVTVTWPSGLNGVRWRSVEEPGQHLELRSDVAATIEEALVTSLATLAAGTSPS